MTRYLIIGNEQSQSSFIENQIREHSIPGHLVIRFDPPFSIKNAHSLRNLLSFAVSGSEKRCIIIPSEMSLEAQNALLKLIEELDEKSILIIVSGENGHLLPTIVSRVRQIRLDTHFEPDKDITTALSVLDSPCEVEDLMKLSVFLSDKKEDVIKDVLFFLGSVLKKSPGNNRIIALLDAIFEDLEIFYNNNLHKRFFWDTVLLSSAK